MIKYGYKEIKNYIKQDNKMIEMRSVLIVLEDDEYYYPHPITHFIVKYYYKKNSKINTILAAVKKIVPFLNYVLREAENNNPDFYGVEGLADLKNKHVSLYLQYCVNRNGDLNSTSILKERYLSKFINYLEEEKVLKNKANYTIKTFVKDNILRRTKDLDLLYRFTNEENLNRRIKRKDILSQDDESLESKNKLRLEKIYEFLYLAEQIVPDIAFGVALQIFAGLRKGEVINLLIKLLKSQNGSKYGENGIIIDVKSNSEKLFGRLENSKEVGVKKPRIQSVLIDPIICYLYKKHIENIIPSIKNKKNNSALFYDKNGNPMSAETYDKRFMKLKDAYLTKLLYTKGRKSDFDDFNDTRWRSHICRGIFTNMCLDAGYTVYQTAILRGDSSSDAVKSYNDIISATNNITRILNIISPNRFNIK